MHAEAFQKKHVRRKPVAAVLAPHQLGVGISGGSQALGHAMRAGVHT